MAAQALAADPVFAKSAPATCLLDRGHEQRVRASVSPNGPGGPAGRASQREPRLPSLPSRTAPSSERRPTWKRDSRSKIASSRFGRPRKFITLGFYQELSRETRCSDTTPVAALAAVREPLSTSRGTIVYSECPPLRPVSAWDLVTAE